MKSVTAEIWVLVNQDGDVIASDDRDAAVERYGDLIGDYSEAEAVRWVRVKLTIPLPQVVEVSAEIGAESSTVDVRVS